MRVAPVSWRNAQIPPYQLLQDLLLAWLMTGGEMWPRFLIEDSEASQYDCYLRQAFYPMLRLLPKGANKLDWGRRQAGT